MQRNWGYEIRVFKVAVKAGKDKTQNRSTVRGRKAISTGVF